MQAVGEVLSSRIKSYIAESWTEDDEDGQVSSFARPSFGSFLKSRSEDKKLVVFGVVYDIVTGPRDQQHRPAALQMTRAELKKEQPQIFALLKTEWHVTVVAYQQDGRVYCGLPPFPPQVHDFVYMLENDEILEVSENLDFLRMLCGVEGVPEDELLAATIRHAAASRHDNYKYLVEAGQKVSKLLHEDYERLGALLKKIKP